MIVPLLKLWSPNWKIKETREDILAGKVSRTHAPIRVSRWGSKYYVMDGNHRVQEALQAGKKNIEAVVDEHVPNMNRTGGAYNSMLETAVRVDAKTNPKGRAKAGGERGVNNEWYEGGKFLPSRSDRAKEAPAHLRSGRRAEIEPGIWAAIPGDWMVPIWGTIKHFVDHQRMRRTAELHLAPGLDFGPRWPYLPKADIEKRFKALMGGYRWVVVDEAPENAGKFLKEDGTNPPRRGVKIKNEALYTFINPGDVITTEDGYFIKKAALRKIQKAMYEKTGEWLDLDTLERATNDMLVEARRRQFKIVHGKHFKQANPRRKHGF